jgi:hypothetical protein
LLREGWGKDPLLDVVEVLEANYVLVHNLFTDMRGAFSRLYGILFPKKKKEMTEKRAKLVEVFNADEDSTVDLKWNATEIGAEIAIALAMSHKEKVDLRRSAPHLQRTKLGKPRTSDPS